MKLPARSCWTCSLAQFENQPDAGPEALLRHADQEVKALISKLLTTAPRYEEEQREQIAAAMLGWLEQRSMQRRKTRMLTEKIQAAQRNHDDGTVNAVAGRRRRPMAAGIRQKTLSVVNKIEYI